MSDIINKSLPAINAVDGFNPAEFTRELPEEDGRKSLYLDVKYRLLWFRLHRPNGKVVPEIIHCDDKSAIVSCTLYEDKADTQDQFVARASAQRFRTDEKFGDRYLEIAETAALGRVLAAAGYGTQFIGTTDMLSGVIADAPLELQDDVGKQLGVPETQPPATVPQNPAVATAPTQPQQAAKPASAPAVAKMNTLEDYLNTMTIDQAKAVMVDVGYNKGKTLGDVALSKPSDLAWYVTNYAGTNLALKAGAMLLVQAATQKAS